MRENLWLSYALTIVVNFLTIQQICGIPGKFSVPVRHFIAVPYIIDRISGMSLEAGNRRKSPVTLAVTAGYFFSLKKNNERKFILYQQYNVQCVYLLIRNYTYCVWHML
jgi:hypothetical protein